MKKSKSEKKVKQTAPVACEPDGRYDYETLMRAEEIKSDKKRLDAALAHHKKIKKQIKSLDELKDVVREKVYEEQDEEDDE